MDVEDANSTNTIDSFAFRKIFIHSCSLVMFFIRDKATIFRAPPALRTPLRDIILFRVFVSFSLSLCFSKSLFKKKRVLGYKCGIIHQQPEKKEKRKKEEEAKRRKKGLKKSQEEKEKSFESPFSHQKVCLQTRVCFLLTSTHRTAHKQRDKYTHTQHILNIK